MSFDIFICYEDTTGFAIAVHAKAALKKWNIKAFVAKEDIKKGDLWQETINNCILNCKCFVLILTLSVFVSDQVKEEINLAYSEKKPILPCVSNCIRDHEFFLKSPPFDLSSQKQSIYFNDEYDLAQKLELELMKMEPLKDKCREFFKEKNKDICNLMEEVDNKTYSKDIYKDHCFMSTALAQELIEEFVLLAKKMETFSEIKKSYKDLVSKEDIYCKK
jgi:hypothetical protein